MAKKKAYLPIGDHKIPAKCLKFQQHLFKYDKDLKNSQCGKEKYIKVSKLDSILCASATILTYQDEVKNLKKKKKKKDLT